MNAFTVALIGIAGFFGVKALTSSSASKKTAAGGGSKPGPIPGVSLDQCKVLTDQATKILPSATVADIPTLATILSNAQKQNCTDLVKAVQQKIDLLKAGIGTGSPGSTPDMIDHVLSVSDVAMGPVAFASAHGYPASDFPGVGLNVEAMVAADAAAGGGLHTEPAGDVVSVGNFVESSPLNPAVSVTKRVVPWAPNTVVKLPSSGLGALPGVVLSPVFGHPFGSGSPLGSV